MELQDHVWRVPEVLYQQQFALFRRVSLVLHPEAKQVIPVRTLKDLFEFVLLLAVDLNR